MLAPAETEAEVMID